MGHSPIDPAFQEWRPWNAGRLLGVRRALKQQQIWAIRFWLDQHRRCGIGHFSTSQSTASYAGATWSKSALAAWCQAGMSVIGQS